MDVILVSLLVTVTIYFPKRKFVFLNLFILSYIGKYSMQKKIVKRLYRTSKYFMFK